MNTEGGQSLDEIEGMLSEKRLGDVFLYVPPVVRFINPDDDPMVFGGYIGILESYMEFPDGFRCDVSKVHELSLWNPDGIPLPRVRYLKKTENMDFKGGGKLYLGKKSVKRALEEDALGELDEFYNNYEDRYLSQKRKKRA